MASVLAFEEVRKNYGALRAVDGLTLDVDRGEVFGLLGPNGAGKTTSVSMAIGLLPPDTGAVRVNGGGPTQPGVRACIGLAPQALGIYDDLTGLENLAFFGKIQGLRGARLRERIAWALDFVGLTDRANGLAKTYSGGMKRRLNMAVAVLHDPDLLLLDEPTVGVDPQSRNAIFERILDLKKSGKTIVYTTHYMEEAQRLCDRVGIIDQGKLLALDTVNGLIRAHGPKQIVIAETANGRVELETDDPIAELSQLRASGTLERFTVEEPNLEHVFLHLTGRHLRDV
jgi:ABC-2 type transport system ATP-binding protein